jgi:hypothetical protein
MINWCIENPVKGQPLNPDDPCLRTLEAYVISQRNGHRVGLRQALSSMAYGSWHPGQPP